MRRRNSKTYYALVWSDILNKNVELKGKEVNKDIELPDDPRMLYGANDNDTFKIIKEVVHQKVKYDAFTTKQSVEFYIEKIEYVLPRDVRIIVWEGSEDIYLPSKNYRIMTPQMFEELVDECDIIKKGLFSEGIRLPRNFASILQTSFA